MRARDMSLADQISLLSGSTFWLTQPLPGVAAVMVSDGPHGLRAQAGSGEHLGIGGSLPATCFPTAVTLASSWDEELLREVGAAVAAEARAAGVSVVLGPGMNIKRHPLCGRNFEYFSEDPLLTGRLAAAMVQGIQSGGVGACLKHFAVNNQESHRFVVDAVVDERALREIYLAGFEYAVTHAKPWTVMASYNLVNGTYACDNRRLLTEILRDEWGFDGLVMSDWGATNDRAAGVRAGMDLEMPGSRGAFDPEVLAAVDDGRLDPAEVQCSADRVLDLVAASPPGRGPAVDHDAHDALARRAAARSSVLLTNDGLLPLRDGLSVALIGAFAETPRYQGAGSSLVNPIRVTSARQALAERGVDVTYAPGYAADARAADPRWQGEAARLAGAADVVVLMVGLPGAYESEGFDREDLHLPREQEELIDAVCAANPRTVVALSNGAPLVMPWVDRPAAILESYLGGQASGAALVDVLFGDEEPAGRLAETFPQRAADVSSDPHFPGHPHQVEYREGIYVGYRYATTAGIAPLFCFGHGLGYTTFAIGECAPEASRISAGESAAITVQVTNTGEREGSTVVQVYRYDRTGRVPRPRRELVGFAKVRLAPGVCEHIRIEIPARGFAFYDTSGWQTPSGEYDLEVGLSSQGIDACVTVTVTDGFDTGLPPEPVVADTDAQFSARLGRPIPVPRPIKPYSRVSTLGEVSGNPVGKALRAVALRVAGHSKADSVTSRMIERTVEEMPLRAMVLFSQGGISFPVIDSLIDTLNGRPDKPLLAGAKAFAGWATRLIGRA